MEWCKLTQQAVSRSDGTDAESDLYSRSIAEYTHFIVSVFNALREQTYKCLFEASLLQTQNTFPLSQRDILQQKLDDRSNSR
ncbi:hypothetical protein VspSTUT11_31890 [Vibrio sp. STUT-A11]|nr:hypothetical protein VspSTUT11_31890 [Vibrio sp. STUT-A11]